MGKNEKLLEFKRIIRTNKSTYIVKLYNDIFKKASNDYGDIQY